LILDFVTSNRSSPASIGVSWLTSNGAFTPTRFRHVCRLTFVSCTAPDRRFGGHTGKVPTPQHEATLRAVARLDQAIKQVTTGHSEPRSIGWTSELTNRLVEGMRACRWFLATGFDPPEQFGSWLRKNLEEAHLHPGSPTGDFYGAAVCGVPPMQLTTSAKSGSGSGLSEPTSVRWGPALSRRRQCTEHGNGARRGWCTLV
jgi:hypothetical protein